MSPIRYFARTYPRESLLTLLCLLAAALAEGAALAAVVPLLALAMQPPGEELGIAGLEGVGIWVRDGFDLIGVPFSLTSVAIAVSLVMWIKAGLLLVSKRQVGNTVAWVATDMRLRLLSSLFSTRWTRFSAWPLGRLSNAIATEAARTAAAYNQLALAAQFTTLTMVGLGVAMVLSWQLTLLTLAGWLAVGLALGGLVRLARRAGHKQTVVINSLLSRLGDALLNVKLLKTMGRERLIGPLLSHDTQRLQKAIRKQVLAQESLKALQEPLMLLLLMGVLIYAKSTGLLRFEEVTAVLLALTRSLTGATKIQRRYSAAMAHAPALDAFLELERNAQEAVEQLHTGGSPTLERSLELRGVSFSYARTPILEDADLEVPAGEITVLVGGSGAGKTTVSDLFSGLIRPDAGEVLIDGVPLPQIDLAEWRSMIGYVPQELVLFHDSVRLNVSLGDPSITDEAVVEALRAAGVWDVVQRLEGGLDATVGERGTLLSGGQRARIGLARALAARPKLLVLDEATAALDSDTEALVVETLEGLRGRVTILAISHQPALAAVADRVYRVEGGKAHRLDKDAA